MTARDHATFTAGRARDGAPEDGQGGGAGGLFRLALPLYLGLLIVAAYMGAGNQQLRARQASLVADKTSLQASVARAEVRAASVEGPLAVAEWARAAGMVPLPQGHVVAVAAPEPAPEFTLLEPNLELRTVWR